MESRKKTFDAVPKGFYRGQCVGVEQVEVDYKQGDGPQPCFRYWFEGRTDEEAEDRKIKLDVSESWDERSSNVKLLARMLGEPGPPPKLAKITPEIENALYKTDFGVIMMQGFGWEVDHKEKGEATYANVVIESVYRLPGWVAPLSKHVQNGEAPFGEQKKTDTKEDDPFATD